MGNTEQFEEIGARPHFVLLWPFVPAETLSSSHRRAYRLYDGRLWVHSPRFRGWRSISARRLSSDAALVDRSRLREYSAGGSRRRWSFASVKRRRLSPAPLP